VILERADVGAGSVYFRDAAGNVAELIANPHLEDGEEAFGPRSLIEVAEIGIAAADPRATRDALCDFFAEGTEWSDAELFAVGDRRTVVIVAPLGRGWIPVDLPARSLPTEIAVRGAEERELTLPEGPYRLRVEPV
jgi:hypothetical protein